MAQNPPTSPPGSQVTPANQTLNIPTIPTATDLPSALVALNTVAQAISQIALQLAAVQVSSSAQSTQSSSSSNINQFALVNTATQNATNAAVAQSVPASVKAVFDALNGSAFQVLSQGTQDIKITDPNDPTVFVVVTQVTSLVLKNPVTGELWEWAL